MSSVKHVVFDIGKVLIHYDPELPYRRLIPDAEKRRWFLDTVCTGDWNIEQDRGRSWAEAETLLIDAFPEEAENIRAFRRNWREMVPHAYEESVTMMKRLIDGGRDVTMLTNFAADTYEEACTMFPFLTWPRGVTVSGRIGMLKPDREIYEHRAGAFGLEPSATLFIDDSEKNVEGAREAGWQALHFTDPNVLKAALVERDLLPGGS